MPATLIVNKHRFSALRATGRALRRLVRRVVGRVPGAAEGERGAAAVEYALLVALIAVAIIGAVFLLGGKLNNTYTCVGNALPAGSSSSPTASC